ncbi:hypothetical protein [Moheibacter lacus]|uniref:Uncharacterized protein n=1 Tax=Moheibacter lacus TaxID=2745851 RepID=A0A838ZR17_9FLAO|nr:hypothetical protein [Moheibacter lacus]MBA5628642.1 hypothetical protein [Moheibacter lacus]
MNRIQKNKRLVVILSLAAVILSLPLIAMQFTSEVNWNGSDFLIMGILLFGTGILCEIILRMVKTPRQRLIFCGMAIFSFLVIWAEMAVGIFNSPIAGS